MQPDEPDQPNKSETPEPGLTPRERWLQDIRAAELDGMSDEEIARRFHVDPDEYDPDAAAESDARQGD